MFTNLENQIAKVRATAPLHGEVAQYNFLGLPSLRKTVAAFMSKYFTVDFEVEDRNIAVSAGAGSIIESLAFCLCEPGDAVLVPAPSYAC